MSTQDYAMEPWRGLVAEPEFGSVAMRIVGVHSKAKCDGQMCSIHNPSDHALKDAPLVLRLDKSGIMERQCEHGIGHSDPDSIGALLMLALSDQDAIDYVKALAEHGCDGCCL